MDYFSLALWLLDAVVVGGGGPGGFVISARSPHRWGGFCDQWLLIAIYLVSDGG
jgi:hypothetical protein